jgi:hypothetical protein
MEFTPRGNRGPTPQAAPAPHHVAPQSGHSGRRKHVDWAARTIRFELFTVIVGSALLLAAVSLFIAFSGGVSGEAKKVDKSKYQAVFLNGGVTSGSVSYSTYFGHITKMNDKYIVLNNVYYLTDQGTAQGSQSASPQLTKLGCQQLHSPYDEMIINRSQLAFWENIKDEGKVVQAIKQFQQQNPNGPNCSQTSNGSNTTGTGSSTQTPATTNSTTNNTTTNR